MTNFQRCVLTFYFVAASFFIVSHVCAGPPQRGKQKAAVPGDRLYRAGHPHRIAWYAVPSAGKHYAAGYVGGGAVVKGHVRLPDEGTWGLDYAGALLKKRIWLGWWHGRRAQDGGGTYKTDGPHLHHR